MIPNQITPPLCEIQKVETSYTLPKNHTKLKVKVLINTLIHRSRRTNICNDIVKSNEPIGTKMLNLQKRYLESIEAMENTMIRARRLAEVLNTNDFIESLHNLSNYHSSNILTMQDAELHVLQEETSPATNTPTHSRRSSQSVEELSSDIDNALEYIELNVNKTYRDADNDTAIFNVLEF